MASIFLDVRYAIRMLAGRPGLLVVGILSLGLGIGANTAIFSLVNAVLLRPMPVPEPDRIVSIYTSDFSGPAHGTSSYADFLDFRDKTTEVMSGVAAFSLMPKALDAGGRTERILTGSVSGNYFQVLGARAALGRTFLPEEDATPGTHPVVVVSEGFHRRRLGGTPDLEGKTLRLGNRVHSIVGVVPDEAARFMRVVQVDVFVPAMMDLKAVDAADRGMRGFMLLGRLRPGAPIEQAQAAFTVLAAQLHKQFPDPWTDLQKQPRRITVLPESLSRVPPEARLQVWAFMAILLSVVGLVLLIACANLANVLLARTLERRREVAVKLALGCGRWRLIRQLLTENLALAVFGGLAGLVFALWTTDLLMAFQPPLEVTLALDLGLDWRVLAFTFVVTLATAVIFGLAPALQAGRTQLVPALKESGAAEAARHGRFSPRGALVAAQAAASVLLLIGAGLFVRSLQNAQSIDLGFDGNNLALLSTDLGIQNYPREKKMQYLRQALDRVRAVPGVQSATAARMAPLGLGGMRRSVSLEGYTPRQGEDMELYSNVVGPSYFETMGISLQRGRGFTAQDREGAARVVIVNEALAGRYWPGLDPLGKRIGRGSTMDQPMTVIGVARNSKYNSLGEDPPPFVYYPLLQSNEAALNFHVRTATPVGPMTEVLRRELQTVDKEVPVHEVKTMNEHLALALLPGRVAATLLGAFSLLALMLSSIGLYGVLSYAVSRRTREIGIRMALGAGRRETLRMVLFQGMRLAVIGLVVGLAAAIGLTRFLAGFLYGISPVDAATFVTASLLLALIAMAACYVPARRASRVDPMRSLRYE